jgi:uncharacterized membrane protein YeaQ/YmgE (transglycosylase-associated protein family)
MNTLMFADIAMVPGGWIAWALVGLIAGFLAGTVMRGGGFGILGDIIVGLIGSLVGGFVSGYFIHGVAGFWGSVAVSFVGACILIGLGRLISPARTV